MALSRVPAAVRERLNPSAQERAFNPCGCELRFNLEGDEAVITLRKDVREGISPMSVAEVYYGPFQAPYLVSPVMIGAEPTRITVRKPEYESILKAVQLEALPFDPRLIRIILPYDWKVYVVGIEGELSPPRPEQVPPIKYISYGSSITHGGDALRPTGSYAMRVAQRLGVDLFNFGSAGSAQMDAAAADYIAARQDWHFATVEMGINVISYWEPAEFEAKVDYFLSTISEKHPDQWMFCTDLFLCNRDLQQIPRIEEYRSIVKRQVERLGQSNKLYIPGTELLSSYEDLTADLVHPSAHGQEAISARLSQIIQRHLPFDLLPAAAKGGQAR
nr:GDSL-type esterase/lipase family protein [Paenibacillus turpanensis]